MGSLSGREYIKRYFTLSHDGVAAMFMNEAEFDAMAAMAEARTREQESRLPPPPHAKAATFELDGVSLITVVEDGESDEEDDETSPSLSSPPGKRWPSHSSPLPPPGPPLRDGRHRVKITVTDPIAGVGSVLVPEGVDEGDSFDVFHHLSTFSIIASAGAGSLIEVLLPHDTDYSKSMHQLHEWHSHQNEAATFAQTFKLTSGLEAIELTGVPREICLRGPRFGKHKKLILKFDSDRDLEVWVNRVRQEVCCVSSLSPSLSLSHFSWGHAFLSFAHAHSHFSAHQPHTHAHTHTHTPSSPLPVSLDSCREKTTHPARAPDIRP